MKKLDDLKPMHMYEFCGHAMWHKKQNKTK